MKTVSGIFGFILIGLALAFALSNRQTAAISLWPFGIEIQAPLYLLTLGTLLFGVLIGTGIAWFNLLPHQFKARQLQKDVAALQDKVSDLQQATAPPVVQTRSDGFQIAGPKPKWRFWESAP